MIPLLQTKTADTAHMGIFASDIRPLSRFLGGAWGRGYVCTVVLRKRPMGGTHYFVLRQGGGRILVTSLHFTMKKRFGEEQRNYMQSYRQAAVF